MECDRHGLDWPCCGKDLGWAWLPMTRPAICCTKHGLGWPVGALAVGLSNHGLKQPWAVLHICWYIHGLAGQGLGM